ncbi:MAG: cytochrome c oxidase subunit 3, partial [Polyangiales bacterium]
RRRTSMAAADRHDETHAAHFESLEQQSHAAHLGMWVFLASEVLLFAGLFALYAAYRAHHGRGFEEGIEHSARTIGSINTGVLLCSSYSAASSVLALRQGKRGLTLLLLAVTILLGFAFLGLKAHEYLDHFHEGVYPGGAGRFFVEHPTPGLPTYFTLYFLMTGLHVIHVTAGLLVLAWLGFKVWRGTLRPPKDHPLALGVMYWHLVDIIWIFLWPLFYLTGGGT